MVKKYRGIKIIIYSLLLIPLFAMLVLSVLSRRYPLSVAENMRVITKCADFYGLDRSVVFAVIMTESGFKQNVVSPKGAGGLMQLTKPTADWGAKELNLENYSYDNIFDPKLNVELGCWYLSKLVKQYGDYDTALAAYNAGSGNASKWLKDPRYSLDGRTLYYIPFGETEKYVKKIASRRKVYKILLNIYDFMGPKYYQIFVEQGF